MFKRLITKLNLVQRNYTTSSSLLLIDKLETVLYLKLNRPDQRNCLNNQLICQLTDELIKFQKDNNLKSIVLTGSGGNFCCGLDSSEIKDNQTLKSLSKLIQLFPLNKPSIVGLEGYASCVGLQLALAFDYKIVENDCKLEFGSEDQLPLHPYIKQFYSIDQLSKFKNASSDESYLKELVNENLITKNCKIGCCSGVALEAAKCIEKFSIESIIYDRKKLYDFSDDSLKENLFEILNDKNLYTRASRFLDNQIGRHGASNIDTLDEIYAKWKPKLVQENEL